MGLKKLVFTSITSTLHDKWEEYITSGDLGISNLVLKKDIKSGLSSKVRIEVKEGEMALICDASRIIDGTNVKGIYTFDASSSPLIYSTDDVKFREAWNKIRNQEIGDNKPEVIFINTKELHDKFGVSSPVLYKDTYIRYYGEYSFRITNPFNFLLSLNKEEFLKNINIEVIKAISNSLELLSKEIPYMELYNNSLLLTKYTNKILNDMKKDLYFEITNVKILNVSPVDNQVKLEKKKEEGPLRCPNCSLEVTGNFCPNCGTKIKD